MVAFVAQLLNTVLVLLLVNARPAASATAEGTRVGEDDIQWLRYAWHPRRWSGRARHLACQARRAAM